MGYIFPLLTTDEIVQILRGSPKFPDVSIDLLTKPQNYVGTLITTNENNAKPTEVVNVLDMYVLFWEILSNTSDIRNMPWHEILVNQPQLTQFPQLYEDAARFLCVFRVLQHVMQLSGITDFGFADILRPEAKRLRRNLSALINFCRFKEDEIVAEQEDQQIISDLDSKLTKMHENVRALRRNVDRAETEQAEEKALYNALIADEEAMKQEMHALHIFKTQSDIDDATREIAFSKEQTEITKGEMDLLREGIVGLKKRIISDCDPAQLVSEVDEMRLETQNKLRRADALKAAIKKLENEVYKSEKAYQRCEKFLEKVDLQQHIVNEAETVEQELEQVKQQIDECTADLQAEEEKIEKHHNLMASIRVTYDKICQTRAAEKRRTEQTHLQIEGGTQRAGQELEREQMLMKQNVAVAEVEKDLQNVHDCIAKHRDRWASIEEQLKAAWEGHVKVIEARTSDAAMVKDRACGA